MLYFYQIIEEGINDIVPKKGIITSQKDLSLTHTFPQLTKQEDRRLLLSREEPVDLLEKVSKECLDRGVFLFQLGEIYIIICAGFRNQL